LLLTASISVLVYLAVVKQSYIQSSYLIVLLLAQILEFIRYANKTTRDLNSYFQSILQGDFSTSFSTRHRSKAYHELYASMNLVNKKLSDISTAKEIQFQHLETIIAHIQVALISFNENEDILLINAAAKQLFDKPILNNLKSIERVNPKIAKACRNITANKQLMVSDVIKGEIKHLAIRCSEIKLDDQRYKLVTLQNIKHEMEAQEVESWQKLIRVLAHEIMNSVAPITSLSETLHDLVQNQKLEADTNSVWINNLITGLEAIKSRSSSLHSFTESYQDLTRLPKPIFALEQVVDLFTEIELLFAKDLEERGIQLKIKCQEKVEHQYDKSLISQVLVNLIKNSIEALEGEDQAVITLTANSEEGILHISVADNGTGIEDKYVDDVFVPFFTTKEKGNGIGLALSRQILHLHNGSIKLNSKPGNGAEFVLTL